MLITQKDVDRLAQIVKDLESGRLPEHLSQPTLTAFFVENPHLLMGNEYDEHMQESPDNIDKLVLKWGGVRYGPEFRFPSLRFRIPSGRWTTLVSAPSLTGLGFSSVMFSFAYQRAREVAKQMIDDEEKRNPH